MTARLKEKSVDLWQTQSAQLSLAALCSQQGSNWKIKVREEFEGISKGTAELASHGEQGRQKRKEVRNKLTDDRKKRKEAGL